ncbi:STAS domain-containing protein [uncultured Desulfobacter sp.]|uniref:STAS domain-containing protein n=1 Tax=uncultured Desulfobacter sp. TaxID=240139 RepID=UPI002AAAC45F|nr:STAS domain-containing protein [uncultured Desulfobacter sp.]
MDIGIQIQKQDNFSIVAVSGKIDAITSDGLEGALIDLIDQGEKHIILDLEKTTYISSAGLRILIVITKQLYDDGQFCLCNANDNVHEIIEMAGFNVFMNIYSDLTEAKSKVTDS